MNAHLCHHPDCRREVEPRYLACRPHWFALTSELRARILATYRAGQEIDKRPSAEYLAAFDACVAFWKRSPARNSIEAAQIGSRQLLLRLGGS